MDGPLVCLRLVEMTMIGEEKRGGDGEVVAESGTSWHAYSRSRDLGQILIPGE